MKVVQSEENLGRNPITESHCHAGAEPGLRPIGSAERANSTIAGYAAYPGFFHLIRILPLFHLDRVRHNNELYETVCEATTCHHGMRLVSGEQSEGISCPQFPISYSVN